MDVKDISIVYECDINTLNSENIKSEILKQIRNIYVNNCTKEYGYIIKIKGMKILSNSINNVTGNIIFNLIYKAEVLKPYVGKIIETQINMIGEEGIFVSTKNLLKILLPADKLLKTKWVYDFSTQSYTNKITKNKMFGGDELQVEITNVRYNRKQFVCIGKPNLFKE